MIKLIKILMFAVSSFIIGNIHAQKAPKIDTDRPDQTESTGIVPKGYFQMENGFTYNATISNENTIFLPSSLWKVGVNGRFELRMITEPQVFKIDTNSNLGLPPVRFGFKSRLVDGKGAISDISFIAQLSNPFLSTENLRGSNFTPDFRVTLNNALSDKLSLGYNLGMSWNDGISEPHFQYTCALGYEINTKWKTYIELFGDKPQKNEFQLSTSAGLYYYPVPNIMFDFTAAYGLVNTDLNYYTALGFSFLVPMKKKSAILPNG